MMKSIVQNQTSSQRATARLLGGLALLVLLLLLVPVRSALAATTYYWDADGNGANGVQDGAGTWDTGANWYNGSTDVAWPSPVSGVTNNAVIGATNAGGGTITIGGNVVVSTISFASNSSPTVNYTLSGGTLNMTNSATIGFLNTGLSPTINSVIADGGTGTPTSVTFGSSIRGTMTLGGGGNNTFSGSATLNTITVNFDNLANGGSPSSFGQGDTTKSVFVCNGASFATANYTGNGGSTDRRWSVSGTGGGTINNSGFGAISFNSTAAAVGGTAGNRILTLGGNYTANASTFCGTLSDLTGFTTRLIVSGATWNVLGTNSHSGGTTISGGTLQITNDIALGNTNGGISFSGSGTLAAINLGAPVRTDVTIGSSRKITVITNFTGNFKTPDTNNLIVAAYITGPGHVKKADSSFSLGTVRFSNDTNDFTGTFAAGYGNTEFTSVANSGTPSALGNGLTNSGTIVLANGNSSGTLSFVGTNNSSTTRPLNWTATGSGYALAANGNNATIAFLAAGNLVSGSGTSMGLTLQGSNPGTNTLAQVINDLTGGVTKLTKSGSGQWVLTAANTYSGPTTISGGTLSVSSDGNLGTAPVAATPNALTINGGALSASASFTLNANRGIALGPTGSSGRGTLDVAAGQTLTYGGIISTNDVTGTNFDSLVKTGAGILTLSGANTYNGNTTISGGTLALTGSGTLGTGTNLIINAGGTFDVSALGGGYALTADQFLLASNGPTVTINGSLNAAAASVVLSNVVNTPTINVTGGALTLGASTPFAVNVNNGGTPLSAGNYKLISKGAGGSVAGTAPSTVTVGGDGLAVGATASLSISSGELYLDVVGGATPSTPEIGGIQITGGQAVLTFSGTNGTWYVLSSSNLTTPLSAWITNATGTFSSSGSIVNWTNPTPTAPQDFYRIKSQ